MRKIIVLVLSFLFLNLSTSFANAQSYPVPFNTNSIWNKPIPANPQLVPNSTQMIQYLMTAFSTIHIDGITGAWSVPVYTSTISSPIQTICDIQNQHPCITWPVPTNILTSPDDDGKMAIVDPIKQRVFSGWRFNKSTASGIDWTIDGGAFGWSDISSNGDGIHVWEGGQSGGRVSSWNYYAGLIYPEEIAQGHIDHALHINIPASRAKLGYSTDGFVWPAKHSDGQSTDLNAIPVGSHFQLDPSVNVDSLNLSPGAKVIAKALQKYGAWLGDTGSLTTINAREYLTGTLSSPTIDSSPWSGIINPTDFYNIFPMDKMRILSTNQSDYYQETQMPGTPSPTTSPTQSPSPSPFNGSLGLTDYSHWFNHINLLTSNGILDGDFNFDNKVNGVDYVIWVTHYNTSTNINSFTLINTTDGSAVQTLNTSNSLTSNSLLQETVKADVSSNIKSVKWTTSNNYNSTVTINIDNTTPFTLVCDGTTWYCPWNVGGGIYTVKAEAFDNLNATGNLLDTKTFTVTVQ